MEKFALTEDPKSPAPTATAKAVVAPPKALAAFRAGGQVLAIIPQDIDQVWRIAGLAVMGNMAPKSLVEGKEFDEAQSACAIAIMAGAELGLTPLTALRSYAVVNGRPSLWGDGIKAVVRQSGRCEYIRAGGDMTKGWCEAKRSDTGEVMRREFTLDQARRANLTNKKGPWQEYPDMMMERRATFRCLNDLFADVLGGLADASDPLAEISDAPTTASAAAPARPTMPAELPEIPEDEPDPPEGGDGKVIEGTASEVDEKINTTTESGDEAGAPGPAAVDAFVQRLTDDLANVDDEAEVMQIFDDADPQTNLAGNNAGIERAFAVRAERIKQIRDGLEAAGQASMAFPGDMPFPK